MKNLLHLKRIWLLILAPASFLLILAGSRFPDFAEGYATTVYPVLSLGINRLTSLAPVSLAEWATALFVLAVLLYLIVSAVRIIKSRGRRLACAGRAALNLLCAASVLYSAFVLSCGMNYYRHTFAQVSGLTVAPSSKAELETLCAELADSANRLRGQVKTDENSVMKLSFDDIAGTAKEAESIYGGLEKDYPTLQKGYGPPKPVINSRLMSYCNITGIFFPFTFEANVNADIPDYSIPAVMCHELTHLRGYMREDEANFVAYLACRQSGNTDFEYSGTMLAFVYAGNALYAADPDAGGKVYAGLSDGVRRDFAANSEYWQQFEGPVAETASKVNDTYLKSNSQDDGVKSYGRMVDLLLADYRHRHAAS